MIIPPLRLELLPTDEWFAVPRYRPIEDWEIILGPENDNLPLIFPRTFETDLASIPRLFWNIPGFNPAGPLRYGSLPHDLGYQYQYLLSPFEPRRRYGEASLSLREQFPREFGDLVPVFVRYPQEFFDNLLAGMTKEATGARFIAWVADAALGRFGGTAWNNYRRVGPTAYNRNSLGLPGMTTRGPVF